MSKRMVWEPVEDGMHHTDGPEVLVAKGARLEIYQDSSGKWVNLPKGMALCRQIAAPPLPDGVREAIEYALHTGWDEYNQTLPEALAHRSVLLEWLTKLEADDE